MPLRHLEPRDRDTLERVRRELREVFGASLRAVALTSEAAGAGYRPGRSPLDLAVVIDEVTPEALRRLRPRLRAWARRRVSTPLVVDARWLEESRDAFPLELLELSEHHVPLHGEADPFAALAAPTELLRLEVERQLRGKLLHLWEAYLEHGASRRRLRSLLLETPPGFGWILRGALRVLGGESVPRPEDAEALLDEVERRAGAKLATLRFLERVRRGGEALPRGSLDAVFEGYLADVRRLVGLLDAR